MDEIAGSDQKICHSLDKYFLSIASNLNLYKDPSVKFKNTKNLVYC